MINHTDTMGVGEVSSILEAGGIYNSGWWQLKYFVFMFTPIWLGKISQFDVFSYFSRWVGEKPPTERTGPHLGAHLGPVMFFHPGSRD